MVAFHPILNRIAQGSDPLDPDYFTPNETHLQVPAADRAIAAHANDCGLLPWF